METHRSRKSLLQNIVIGGVIRGGNSRKGHDETELSTLAERSSVFRTQNPTSVFGMPRINGAQ